MTLRFVRDGLRRRHIRAMGLGAACLAFATGATAQELELPQDFPLPEACLKALESEQAYLDALKEERFDVPSGELSGPVRQREIAVATMQPVAALELEPPSFTGGEGAMVALGLGGNNAAATDEFLEAAAEMGEAEYDTGTVNYLGGGAYDLSFRYQDTSEGVVIRCISAHSSISALDDPLEPAGEAPEDRGYIHMRYLDGDIPAGKLTIDIVRFAPPMLRKLEFSGHDSVIATLTLTT